MFCKCVSRNGSDGLSKNAERELPCLGTCQFDNFTLIWF